MQHEDDDVSREPAGRTDRDEPVEPGARQSHDDTPATMQHDHEDAVGRQRHDDARGSDYAHDFQSDGSGAQPVKPPSEGGVDENGIPEIAATERPTDERGDESGDEGGETGRMDEAGASSYDD